MWSNMKVMRIFNLKISAWIIIVILFLNLLLYANFINESIFGLKQGESYFNLYPSKKNNYDTNLKYIFYNSDNWHQYKWSLIFGEKKKPFKSCEYSNCYISADSSKNIPEEKYAAGIFHVRNNCGQKNIERIKAIRGSISGPFIMYSMESPIHDCGINFGDLNGIFNWTMTYRSNADIVFRYGNTYKLKTKVKLDIQRTLRKKTKLAFWVSSHMGSNGKRDDYASLLRKYMPFDHYGRSTKKSCPNTQGTNMTCKELLAIDYKFYFAFENSLCTDYITEKFFETLNTPAVPVVYGRGPYTSISPPHSFIDVRDFKGPKELAEYLLYLNKNDTAYAEYFQWKEEYRVSTDREETTNALCTLCKKLNNLDYRPAYTSEELNLHWRGTKDNPVCSNARDYIPGF